MVLFTVLSIGPDICRDAVAVFKKESDAKNYIKNIGNENYSISPETVKGQYIYPNPVYAAHPIHRAYDCSKFLGLYATDEEARAQECPGREDIEVRKLIPDDKI